MTAKNINLGIEKLVKKSSSSANLDQHERAWKDLRNKLDSVLLSTNVIKGDAARTLCQALDSMSLADRLAHIEANWGKLYGQKSLPLLQQLDSVESMITKLKNA